MPIALPEDDSVSLYLLVTVPEDATNGTDVMIAVEGEYTTDEDNNLTTDNLNLLLQVRYIEPKPPKEERTIPQQILDWIKNNTILVVVIVALGALGVVAYVIMDKRRKADEALIYQYESYVDSQSQQREMGGGF
jgi:hypothetical protein